MSTHDDRNVEQLVRRALTETAEQVTASPVAGWESVAERKGHRQWNRVWVPVTASAAVVALIVGLIAVGDNSTRPKLRTADTPDVISAPIAYEFPSPPAGYVGPYPSVAYLTDSNGRTTISNGAATASTGVANTTALKRVAAYVCLRFHYDAGARVCDEVSGTSSEAFISKSSPTSSLYVSTVVDPEFNQFSGDTGQTVTVRGHTGVFTTSTAAPAAATALLWRERPGAFVTLSSAPGSDGAPLDQQQLLALADQLQETRPDAKAMPFVVASGTVKASQPGETDARWLVMVRGASDKPCGQVGMLSARTPAYLVALTGVRTAECALVETTGVQLFGEATFGNSMVVGGSAAEGAAKVVVTPDGGVPIDASLTQPDARLRARFFGAVVPPSTQQYAVEAFDADGKSFARSEKSSSTGAPARADFTGPQVTIKEGDYNGKRWTLVARPTERGFCYGLGYDNPQPSNCYAYDFLGTSKMSAITNTDPPLVLGLVSNDVAKVQVDHANGTLAETEPLSAPAGFSGQYGKFVIVPVDDLATVRAVVAYDRDGNELARQTVTGESPTAFTTVAPGPAGP